MLLCDMVGVKSKNYTTTDIEVQVPSILAMG